MEVQVLHFESIILVLICAFFRKKNISEHKTSHSTQFSAYMCNEDLPPSLHIHL
jgi:hypothetical protein